MNESINRTINTRLKVTTNIFICYVKERRMSLYLSENVITFNNYQQKNYGELYLNPKYVVSILNQ